MQTKRKYWESYPVDDFLGFEGSERLRHYLRLKTWDIELAAFMLTGVRREAFELLGRSVFYRFDGCMILGDEVNSIADAMQDIHDIYESDPQNPERMTVHEWVNWAEANNIPVPWADWARHRKLITIKNETPAERKNRIKEFVDSAYREGKTKQSAFAEMAKSEGCGIENIKRIYKGKAGN